MRIYKALIISVVVLAVGIAGFFIVREIVRRNTPSKVYELNTVITSLRSDDVEEITVYNDGILMPMKQRSESVFDNDGNKKIIKAWYLVNEEETKLSQGVVDGLVIASSNLVAKEVIEEEAENLDKYGLDGSYYVEGKTSKGVEYKIILGNMLYNRDGFYAKLDGNPTVYAISLYSANNLYTSRAELLDLNVFQGTLSDVSEFSLSRGGEPVFTIKADPVITWVLSNPVEARADTDSADEMINNLLELSREEYVDVAPEDLEAYGLADPDYSVTINISETGYTMLIGNEDRINNTFYAKLSDKNEVFSLDASTLTFLDNEAIDMLFPYPYLPDPGNVKSVDIDIEGMDHLLMEMEYDAEIKMRDYKFNGTSINMVSGIQTWGGFFFEQMVWVEVVEIDTEWEIKGEPFVELKFTYTDDVFEVIQYYDKGNNKCYFVRNGVYNGLVVDKAYLSKERGLGALVDLVLSGAILELIEEQGGE